MGEWLSVACRVPAYRPICPDPEESTSADGTRWPLPVGGLAPGRAVVIGIRPEHLEIAPEGISGRVELVEQTGLDTLAIIHAGGQPIRVLSRGRLGLAKGDNVFLAPDHAKIHLFDQATTRRITA